jgi:hypothetical protein
MDEKQFKILNDKMDRALKLLALNVVGEYRGDDQVGILSAVGFAPFEIADMLGKTRNAVDQALHRLKQEEGKTKRRGSGGTPRSKEENEEGGDINAEQ